MKKLKGQWLIRDNMLRDLFCLNKMEPLPWDCWGTMGEKNKKIDDTESEILVNTANIIVSSDSKTEKYFDIIKNYNKEKYTYERI